MLKICFGFNNLIHSNIYYFAIKFNNFKKNKYNLIFHKQNLWTNQT